MIKKYKLPIQGTVTNRDPLAGSESDPIVVFPLSEIPNRPTYFNEGTQTEVKESLRYVCLEYNIDESWCKVEVEASESVHAWLTGLLPQLKAIQKERGWKLDKSRLEMIR